MTIVLIGPPAAGKTRVGKRLAKRLGLPFVDTDAVVVAGHGAIAEIFAEHGEPYFRALERAAVAEAVARPGIVSLGGGAVLDPDTQADLAATRVVLLTVRPEAIAARITNRKRPLVTDLESWKRLVAARTPLYESLADYTADTSTRPIDTIVEEIARWVESGRTAHGQSTEQGES
ncbi:shikimate kinase [Leifsonia sp. NPDC056665]|uniref:shikimate kinase n=1 Tax=Leifsonia sp. NPDC056665 TaxID=3345901 RepID=UPI0036C0605F